MTGSLQGLGFYLFRKDEIKIVSQWGSDRICTAFSFTLTGPSAVEPPFPCVLLLIRGWKIHFNPPVIMCLYNEIIAFVVQ